MPDTVERLGGRAVKSRVGHAFIKHRIREEGAVFAGEVSGHYYFGDFYGVDTGIVPALLMLELVSRRGGSLAALLRPLRERYHISGEINTRVDDVAVKLQELKERFGPGRRGQPPRRRLDRLPGLALQRAAVQHRAAAAPQPRGLQRGGPGAPPRRGARRHPRRGLSVSGHAPLPYGETSERPPFRFSATTRVGFDETDAQGVVYYGRYMPYFDRARVEYLRRLDLLARAPGAFTEFVMRANHVEYHAPGAVRRPAGGLRARRAPRAARA